MATFFPWILYIFGWLGAAYFLSKGISFSYSLLMFIVFFNGGVQGLWAALGHLVFPKKVAESIGWEPCGFQTEVGFANLAIGIVSIVSFWVTEWVTPAALILAIFFAGCAFVHIKDRYVNQNKAPCNSGPMLYNTITVVFTLVVLLIMNQ